MMEACQNQAPSGEVSFTLHARCCASRHIEASTSVGAQLKSDQSVEFISIPLTAAVTCQPDRELSTTRILLEGHSPPLVRMIVSTSVLLI